MQLREESVKFTTGCFTVVVTSVRTRAVYNGRTIAFMHLDDKVNLYLNVASTQEKQARFGVFIAFIR